MELITDIVREFKTVNIPTEIILLQQRLPDLALQDRMLPQRCSRFQNENDDTTKTEKIKHIKIFRGHYSRLKRKLTLISHKYKHEPIKKMQQLLHFLKRFTNLMYASNFAPRELIHRIYGKMILFNIYLPSLNEKWTLLANT